MILRCFPYKIPLTDLLSPHRISPVEFFRLWPSLPAIVEYTGTYIYEGTGFKATAAQQYGASPFLSGLKSLSSKPFHSVCSYIIRTLAGFQVRFYAILFNWVAFCGILCHGFIYFLNESCCLDQVYICFNMLSFLKKGNDIFSICYFLFLRW